MTVSYSRHTQLHEKESQTSAEWERYDNDVTICLPHKCDLHSISTITEEKKKNLIPLAFPLVSVTIDKPLLN